MSKNPKKQKWKMLSKSMQKNALHMTRNYLSRADKIPITTPSVVLQNFVVFFEFILDDEGTSETPAIITMFLSIGRILASPTFRNYAEKNKTAIPWLTHTLICQFQSVLNCFVDISNNFTYQRKVENDGTLPATLLDAPFNTFNRFMNNLDDALNNVSNTLFGVKPLSYVEKVPAKRKNQSGNLSDHKKSNTTGTPRGWLVCTNGTFSFPKALSKLPCRNFALEGLECSFGCTCKYDHKVFPRGYCRPDQAVICDWVNKTENVRFADCISERDRNIIVDLHLVHHNLFVLHTSLSTIYLYYG